MINEDRHVIVTYEPTAWAAYPPTMVPTARRGSGATILVVSPGASSRTAGRADVRSNGSSLASSWLARSTDGGGERLLGNRSPSAGQGPPRRRALVVITRLDRRSPIPALWRASRAMAITVIVEHGGSSARTRGRCGWPLLGFGGLMEHPALARLGVHRPYSL